MLAEQKDIDAVVIATPDHQHAIIAMAAIDMGKHVYCEKPLTHTVWEARQLAKAAREHKVATQMGNQGQASEETRRLCELIWDNAIGPVREVHVWTDRPANGLVQRVLATRRGATQGHARAYPTRSIGICGSGRRRTGRTIRPTCRSVGAGGGILAPARWATSVAMPAIRCSARSSWVSRSACKPVRAG